MYAVLLFLILSLLCRIFASNFSCSTNMYSGRRIAYFIAEMNERGTPLATFDYSVFNEKLLPGFLRPLIIYGSEKASNRLVEKRFVEQFGPDNVICVAWEKMDSRLFQMYNITDLYYLNPNKFATTDHLPSWLRLYLHYTFDVETPLIPRCSVSAKVSPVVRGDLPIVPHIVRQEPSMVHGPTMRSELNIPANATVFCRYGGYKQFDAQFVKEEVKLIAESKFRQDIYFLFVNTEPFSMLDSRLPTGDPPRILYLEMIIDMQLKSRFIRTCDAMLHARSRGETFGLAVAEFSAHNKPVITYDRGRAMTERHHIITLGRKGKVFKNSVTLSRLLLDFNRTEAASQEWNAYGDYAPEKVTAMFKSVFLRDTGDSCAGGVG